MTLDRHPCHDESAAPLPADRGEAVRAFAASEVARDPLGETTHEDSLRLISLELAAALHCVMVWELGRGFEAA